MGLLVFGLQVWDGPETCRLDLGQTLMGLNSSLRAWLDEYLQAWAGAGF